MVGDRTLCPPDSPPDLLSEVLHDLRLAHAAYGRSELTAPWGIEIPFKEGVRFHFLAEGSCWMKTASQPPIFLDTGDVVLLPRGTGHTIADEPSRPASPLKDVKQELVGNAVYRLSTGGGGERTLIVCCTIGFEGPTAHPLIELLPEVLHVGRQELKDPALPALLSMMADEVLQPQIGSATIMARLADIVMTRIIRAWVDTRPSDLTGWLAAVKDPNIGVALGRIHRQPGHDWNVEALARAAGMSRSKFSERFSHLLGVSPARYLVQWRMRLAATWLRHEYMTVAQAAAQLGYDSDAAFSRAFKRFWGVPPSASRTITS